MQVRDRRTGQMVELPDEYDDDQILGHFSAQGQQAPSLAQSFIGGIQQQAGSQIAQQLAQGPAQSTLPNIGGGAMVGLTPQQAQFTLQSAQQSNVDTMQQKMQQQQMTQQGIENEKDRAQTLKLRQQELKNLVAQKKIQADIDKFEAEQKTLGKAFDAESKAKLEQMKMDAAQKREEGKLYDLNGQLVDRQGQVIADNTRQPAPPAPPTPKLIDTVDENGKPVQKWVLPEAGASYPSQPDAQSTTGQVTEKDWFRDGPQILEEGMTAELEMMRQSNPEATVQPMEWKAINEPRYRQNMGLPPFKSAAAEEAFKKSAADTAMRNTMESRDMSGLTEEGIKQFRKQAEDAAQYEANKLKMSDEQANEILQLQQQYRAKGKELTLKFDPDGTPFLEEPE